MQKKILSQSDQEVKMNFLKDARNFPTFKQWSDEGLLREIIEGSQIERRPPQYMLWQADDPLSLSIVAYGLISVNYEITNPKSIDGFILRGELVGDFEFIEMKSSKKHLTSLTDTLLIKPDPTAIDRLKNDYPKLLYSTIASSLASKLDHRQGIISLLKRNQVIDRLKYLLSDFRSNKYWSFLFEHTGADHNSCEFNVLWSDTDLMSVLSTEFRSIKQRLAAMVKHKAISVDLYERKYEGAKEKIVKTRTLSPEYFLTEGKQKPNTYIKISILDESKLRTYNYKALPKPGTQEQAIKK